MHGKGASRLPALLFIVPFFLVGLFDVLVIERPLSLGQGDGLEAEFGLSLNFLTGHPKRDAHHPGYLASQIGAWMIRAAGQPRAALGAFAAGGTFIHILAVLAAGLWMGVLSSKLRLPGAAVFVIGLMTASMPTMITYSRGWQSYFLFALFTVPAAVGLMKVVHSPRNQYWESFLPFFALGVIFANNLHSSFVVFGLTAGFLLSLPSLRGDRLREKLGLGGGRESLPGGAALVGAALFAYSFYGTSLFWVSLLPAGLACAAIVFRVRARGFFWLFLAVEAPLLAGWAAGVNALGGSWGGAFLAGAGDKGGNMRLDGGFFESAYVSHFFAFSSWTWLLAVAAAVGLMAGVRAIIRRGADKEAVFVSVSVLSSLGSAFFVVWRYVFLPWIERNPFKIGSHLEFICLDLAVPAVALTWIALRGERQRVVHGALLLLGAVCLLSLQQFRMALSDGVDAVGDLNGLVERFFWKNPNGYLICDRGFRPDLCGTLYAYNRFYRTQESLGVLRRKTLLNGKVNYVEDVMACDLRVKDVMDCYPQMPTRPTSLLIAYRNNGRSVGKLGWNLWQREHFKERLLLVDPKLLSARQTASSLPRGPLISPRDPPRSGVLGSGENE